MSRAGVILAAGRGLRMNEPSRPKQFTELGGRPVIRWSLAAFDECPDIDEIILATAPEWTEMVEEIAKKCGFTKVRAVIAGGEFRQESSYRSLQYLKERGSPPEIVALHDAARPFVEPGEVSRVVRAAAEHGASSLAAPVFDTIAREREGFFEETVERRGLFAIQTPQGFGFELIMRAHEAAISDGIFDASDDAGLIARLGEPVRLVQGTSRNMKITTSQDLETARALADLSSGR